MKRHPFKPYGYEYLNENHPIIESCKMCKERIKKRIEKLNGKNYSEITRTITSPIYGEIKIDRITNILIDTCYMQRLRRIKQLSFNEFLFPTANHTRFDHSLGTYYIACKIVNNKYFKNRLQKINKITFKIAALLHDIGHAPFSHFSDELYKLIVGSKVPHEERAKNIIWHEFEGEPSCMRWILESIFTKLKDGISKRQFLRMIAESIRGEDPGEELDKNGIFVLLNGPVDIDKLDYMIRDSYYTGVPFGGATDINKICESIFTERRDNEIKICIEYGAIFSIFTLFSARFAAYNSFINHPLALIAQEMLLRELYEFFKKKDKRLKDKELKKYLRFTDETFISKLVEENKVADSLRKVIFELRHRLLFKKILCFIPKDESEWNDFENRRKKEKGWAKKWGLKESDILIVFVPRKNFFPKEKKKKIEIVFKGKKKREEFSSFFKNRDFSLEGEVIICCRNKESIIKNTIISLEKEFKQKRPYKKLIYKRTNK